MSERLRKLKMYNGRDDIGGISTFNQIIFCAAQNGDVCNPYDESNTYQALIDLRKIGVMVNGNLTEITPTSCTNCPKARTLTPKKQD
jgi:hypothetical protein